MIDDAGESRQNLFGSCTKHHHNNDTGRERCEAVGKDMPRSSDRDRLERDEAAADALEQARQMAPGPERNEALKLAGALRRNADERGLVFAKRGRPRKS